MTSFSAFIDNKRVRRRFEKVAPALRKGCAGAPHSEQNTIRPGFVCCAQPVQIGTTTIARPPSMASKRMILLAT